MSEPLPPHPGTYELVNKTTGEVRRIPISEVPIEAKYAPDEKNTPIPVVRVETHLKGAQRVLLEFGAKGQLLRATTQRRRRE